MDWRNRKYYLAMFDHHSRDMRLENLKIASPTLKIHPPYNHHKSTQMPDNIYGIHDHMNFGQWKWWHMMISCCLEDSEAVEYELKKATRIDYDSCFMEITKEMCGQ